MSIEPQSTELTQISEIKTTAEPIILSHGLIVGIACVGAVVFVAIAVLFVIFFKLKKRNTPKFRSAKAKSSSNSKILTILEDCEVDENLSLMKKKKNNFHRHSVSNIHCSVDSIKVEPCCIRFKRKTKCPKTDNQMKYSNNQPRPNFETNGNYSPKEFVLEYKDGSLAAKDENSIKIPLTASNTIFYEEPIGMNIHPLSSFVSKEWDPGNHGKSDVSKEKIYISNNEGKVCEGLPISFQINNMLTTSENSQNQCTTDSFVLCKAETIIQIPRTDAVWNDLVNDKTKTCETMHSFSSDISSYSHNPSSLSPSTNGGENNQTFFADKRGGNSEKECKEPSSSSCDLGVKTNSTDSHKNSHNDDNGTNLEALIYNIPSSLPVRGALKSPISSIQYKDKTRHNSLTCRIDKNTGEKTSLYDVPKNHLPSSPQIIFENGGKDMTVPKENENKTISPSVLNNNLYSDPPCVTSTPLTTRHLTLSEVNSKHKKASVSNGTEKKKLENKVEYHVPNKLPFSSANCSSLPLLCKNNIYSTDSKNEPSSSQLIYDSNGNEIYGKKERSEFKEKAIYDVPLNVMKTPKPVTQGHINCNYNNLPMNQTGNRKEYCNIVIYSVPSSIFVTSELSRSKGICKQRDENKTFFPSHFTFQEGECKYENLVVNESGQSSAGHEKILVTTSNETDEANNIKRFRMSSTDPVITHSPQRKHDYPSFLSSHVPGKESINMDGTAMYDKPSNIPKSGSLPNTTSALRKHNATNIPKNHTTERIKPAQIKTDNDESKNFAPIFQTDIDNPRSLGVTNHCNDKNNNDDVVTYDVPSRAKIDNNSQFLPKLSPKTKRDVQPSLLQYSKPPPKVSSKPAKVRKGSKKKGFRDKQ